MFKPKTNIPTPLHAYRMNTAERGATGLMRKDESLRDIAPYSFGAGEVGQAQTFKTAPSATDPMALNQQSVGQMLKGPETDEQAMARLSQTRPTRGQTMAAMEGLQGGGNEAYQQFSANLANTGEEARKYADVGTVALKQSRKTIDQAAIKAEQMEESRGTASTVGKFALLGGNLAAAASIKDPEQRRAQMTQALSGLGGEAISKGLDSALKNLGASEEVAGAVAGPLGGGLAGAASALTAGSPRDAVKAAAGGLGSAALGAAGMAAGGPVAAAFGSGVGQSLSNLFPGGSGRSNYLGGTARTGGLKTASEMLKG